MGALLLVTGLLVIGGPGWAGGRPGRLVAQECQLPGDPPPAGTWVEWDIAGETITLGVLEAPPGMWRLESSGPDGAGHRVTVQVVGREYPVASVGALAEAVLEVGEGPAMRLTGPMLGTLAGRQTAITTLLGIRCRGLESAGASTVELAGRRIDQRLWRSRDRTRELALSPDVPFGVVRWVSPGGGRTRLLRWGMGYVTRLKTIPTELPAIPPPRRNFRYQ